MSSITVSVCQFPAQILETFGDCWNNCPSCSIINTAKELKANTKL